MTAVRAMPRSSPGICCSSLGGFLDRVERVEERLNGDAAAGHQLAAGSAHGCDEGCGPDVLEDQQGGRGTRLEYAAGLLDVLVGEQPRRGALEDRQLGY